MYRFLRQMTGCLSRQPLKVLAVPRVPPPTHAVHSLATSATSCCTHYAPVGVACIDCAIADTPPERVTAGAELELDRLKELRLAMGGDSVFASTPAPRV